MSAESIIQSDGSLRIILRHENVSWFDFLGYSRTSRARDSGWNSQRYWIPRGLDVLSRNISSTVSHWTENSLAPEAKPLPREGKFMLDRTHTLARLALPEIETVEVVSENALSFHTFKKYFAASGNERLLGKINLIGYEVPLGRTKTGQLKVDLLGVSSEPVLALEVIELKNADNTGDSPLMALTEAVCYALQILRCKDALLRELRVSRPAETEMIFRKINLHLMAPERYWNLWLPEPSRPAIEAALKQIVDGVNAGINASPHSSASTLTISFGNISN